MSDPVSSQTEPVNDSSQIVPPSSIVPSSSAESKWISPNVVYAYESYVIGDNNFFDVSPKLFISSNVIVGLILLSSYFIYKNKLLSTQTLIAYLAILLSLSASQIAVFFTNPKDKNIILYYLSVTTLFLCGLLIIGGNENMVLDRSST